MKKIKQLTYTEDRYDQKKKHTIGIPNIPAIQKYFGARQQKFTKSMKNISNAIIRHPDILKNNLLVNFSKTLDLGEASVMRFCKHLGFRGFTEFKKYFIEEFFDLPDESHSRGQLYEIDIGENASVGDVLTKVSNLVARITLNTKQGLAQNHIELSTIAEKILYSSKLFIFGSPHERSIVEETAQRFTNIGVCTLWATELQDMVSKSTMIDRNSTLIAISCSGYNQDVLKIVARSQKTRAQTVAITCDPRSELAMICDTTFVTFGNYDKEFCILQDSIYVRLSQMIIFDCLIALIISKDPIRAREKRIFTYNIIEQIISSTDDGPTIL